MMGNRFFIVDVFGERRYTGNQLAVVIVDQPLSGRDMQDIAAEFHFSETTFLLPGGTDKGGFPVRIFTPFEELPFAGHPTLGTAWVIRERLLDHRPGTVVLNLAAGNIPVAFGKNRDDVLWMRQNTPVFGETHDQDSAAAIIGLTPRDMDRRFPVQEVSTGLAFLMMPLTGLDAVKRAHTDAEAYKKYFSGKRTLPLFLFSPETYGKEHRVNARMFAELFDIPEDPATGSAAGCLAGYLLEHRYFGGDSIDLSMEQGFEMGRPSLLHLRAHKSDDSITIEVGGKVHAVAEGRLV